MRARRTHPTRFWRRSEKLTPLPIRYVIDTNADADFVGGNGKLAKAGQTIFTNVLGNAALADSDDQRRRRGDSGARQHPATG